MLSFLVLIAIAGCPAPTADAKPYGPLLDEPTVSTEVHVSDPPAPELAPFEVAPESGLLNGDGIIDLTVPPPVAPPTTATAPVAPTVRTVQDQGAVTTEAQTRE